LGPALRAAHQRIRELPDGFEFEFPGDTATFRLAAEWAEGEHLCCPFFDVDLRLEREGGALWVRLTGRDGVKQFIKADFAGWFPEGFSFMPASGLPSFGQAFDSWVSRIEALVVPAAEAMPDSLYSFAPGGVGFKGVRTFAEQVKHLAANNYQMAAPAAGEQAPEGTRNERAPDAVRTKGDIIAYLKGSFAMLHRAAAAINERNLSEEVGVNGKKHTRSYLLIDALAHSSNHYGQMVEYLRMNGIVPPASR
jgi:DinB superfamily